MHTDTELYKKREQGYYWVSFNGGWTVARFAHAMWQLHGVKKYYQENEFDEIEDEPIFSKYDKMMMEKFSKFKNNKP